MEFYLVGGAVRDDLLGRPAAERDYVVVGATPAEMEAMGYRPVGRDFPVFIHPETGHEYALARTERKSGRGYHGFAFHASPEVTLEQDLERRDLTVNAMARPVDPADHAAPAGDVVDPFGGRADLEARRLRHVSPAFMEDPVRVLRVARFAARFHAAGFSVAEDTRALMRQMVADGEVDHLVAERVWQETERALGEDAPQVYFQVLRDCGALAVVFPELDALFGVPQPERWHPEVDTGVHTLMALEQAARLSDATTVRFATLVHDLGKALTPESEWPSHKGHDHRGIAPVEALCDRLRVPNAHRELGVLATREHIHCHRAVEARPGTVLGLLERCDGFRKRERFVELMDVCQADLRGRTGLEDVDYPQRKLLLDALDAARAASRPETTEGLDGPAIAALVKRQRLEAVTASLAENQSLRDVET